MAYAEPPASAISALPAQTKVIALVGFAFIVVATPLRLWPLFALDAGLLIGLVLAARLSWRWILPRLAIELPIVFFCLLLPFVATGPRLHVGPFHLAQAGLTGAALLLMRATLGILAALVLVGTTRPHELVDGLERLRLPTTLVGILTSMVRSLHLVIDDQRRMTIARQARGDSRGVAGRLAAAAASTGHLFVRSYERGERTQLAMLARGYQGRLPAAGEQASAQEWAVALALPAVALGSLTVGLLW